MRICASSAHGSPLGRAADLALHTLLEEDDDRGGTRFLNSSRFLGWRSWLSQQGQPELQPRRWLFTNFTYQQIQGALAGQGVALARMALVSGSRPSGLSLCTRRQRMMMKPAMIDSPALSMNT